MKLSDQSIVIDAPRELCFEVVAAAGRCLEKRSEEEWIVEFTVAAGDREVRTVELLTLERPLAIHYRWLEGPLPEVSETIDFIALGEHRTRLTYRGEFRVGKGPLGWAIGRLKVRPVFDRLVAEHFGQAKEVAEKRAARSKVYRADKGERDE